jgi:hypothetical protein
MSGDISQEAQASIAKLNHRKAFERLERDGHIPVTHCDGELGQSRRKGTCHRPTLPS